MITYNPKLKKYSQQLRNNMTDAEKLLWHKLRNKQLMPPLAKGVKGDFKGLQFYRQKIIGDYIVDFYCPKGKLVIEVDGGQHYSSLGIANDQARDSFIESQGLKVLRFSDREVLKELDSVLERIYYEISFNLKIPSNSPFSKGKTSKRTNNLPLSKRSSSLYKNAPFPKGGYGGLEEPGGILRTVPLFYKEGLGEIC